MRSTFGIVRQLDNVIWRLGSCGDRDTGRNSFTWTARKPKLRNSVERPMARKGNALILSRVWRKGRINSVNVTPFLAQISSTFGVALHKTTGLYGVTHSDKVRFCDKTLKHQSQDEICRRGQETRKCRKTHRTYHFTKKSKYLGMIHRKLLLYPTYLLDP